MKWNKVSKIFIKGKKLVKSKSLSVKKHAPAIATGVSIFCWGAALVITGLEAPKAHRIWAEKKERDPEASKLELAAAVAPVLWKPVALAAVGAGGEILSLKMMNARVLAATSLATMAMNDRNAIYSAAKDIVGDEKAEEIRSKAAEKQMEKDGKKAVTEEPQTFSEDEKRPCSFGLTGQPFTSSPAKIKNGFEDAIDILASEDSISLEDLIDCIGANEKIGRMKSCALTGNLSYNLWEHDGHGSARERARDMLAYDLKPWTDENGRLGWYVDMRYRPNHYAKA